MGVYRFDPFVCFCFRCLSAFLHCSARSFSIPVHLSTSISLSRSSSVAHGDDTPKLTLTLQCSCHRVHNTYHHVQRLGAEGKCISVCSPPPTSVDTRTKCTRYISIYTCKYPLSPVCSYLVWVYFVSKSATLHPICRFLSLENSKKGQTHKASPLALLYV